MERIINDVSKGVLVKVRNTCRKPSEAKCYFSFWLEADNSLEYLFEFPGQAFYMFTGNEFDRYIRRSSNAASRKLFPLGRMNLFLIGRPSIIVKLEYEGVDSVVRIPMAVVKRALRRSERNPEDSRRPGILNTIATAVTEALKK